MRAKTLLSDAGLVYAAAVWGATFFVVKDALAGIAPSTLVAYRFLIAAAILGIVGAFQRKDLFHNLRDGIMLGAVLCILYFTQTVGLQRTSASNSGFITGLFVIFVPIFTFLFFRRLPSRKQLVAIAISVAGLWLLTGGLRGMNMGDALTIGAAVAYALQIWLVDRYVKTSDPLVLTFQQFLVVGIASLGAALVLRDPLGATASAWHAVLFLAIFPTLTAFLIQTFAQRHTGPVKVALIFTLEPVFAALFAWTLGGEQFIAISALGGLLIVTGMVIASLPERRAARQSI
jgi:drug/metabolite transporter (DMT)-like permease